MKTTAIIIILTLIGMSWTILYTVMQHKPEKYQYCSACLVCERQLCEGKNND